LINERIILLLIFDFFLYHLELVSRKWFVLEAAIFTHGILRVWSIGAEALNMLNRFWLVKYFLRLWWALTLWSVNMIFLLDRVFTGRACEAAKLLLWPIIDLILTLNLNLLTIGQILVRLRSVLVLASLSRVGKILASLVYLINISSHAAYVSPQNFLLRSIILDILILYATSILHKASVLIT